ncbi:hypothetical protein GIB67_024340 [Kingdonia uniflora]|uniref:Pentatricopeptide repeat-containing protein n=1 Tax=Kingdonia uniflora TaxID=39325 RepID=A0A7J7LF11_9MAGN|nr:hypothetical protein GIB67_024340 [Kingdonia uniflora]
MYAHCNSLRDARKVFDGIRKVNLANPVNWNTAISCFLRCEDHKGAYELFCLMKCPSDYGFCQALLLLFFPACGQLRDLCFGEQVHGYAIKISLYDENDGFVRSSLVDLYGHAGLVEEGLTYFKVVDKEYGITPLDENHGSVVDLLARAGRLDEAKSFIEEMPKKLGPSVWGALLGACKIYKEKSK